MKKPEIIAASNFRFEVAANGGVLLTETARDGSRQGPLYAFANFPAFLKFLGECEYFCPSESEACDD